MNAILCNLAIPGRRAGAAIAGGARLGLRLLACLAVLAALFLQGAPRAHAAAEPSVLPDGWCNLSDLTPPGKPSFTIVVPTDDAMAETSIRLRWNGIASSSGSVTDYLIYVATAEDQHLFITLIAGQEPAWALHDAEVSGLTPDTTYNVRLRARTILGCFSDLSDVRTVTTAAADGS